LVKRPTIQKMKLYLLVISVTMINSVFSCGGWDRPEVGGGNWRNLALDDLAGRIDRAIPELGLLEDRRKWEDFKDFGNWWTGIQNNIKYKPHGQ